MKLNAIDFEEAIKQLNNYVGGNEYRVALTGIHVKYTRGNNYILFEATNSYIANILQLRVLFSDDFDEDVDMILRPFKYKVSSRTTDIVQLNFKDMYVFDGVKTSLNRIDDNYPSLDCIKIPQGENTVTFNVGNMKKIIKSLKDDDTITLTYDNDITYKITTDNNNKNYKDNTIVLMGIRRVKYEYR